MLSNELKNIEFGDDLSKDRLLILFRSIDYFHQDNNNLMNKLSIDSSM